MLRGAERVDATFEKLPEKGLAPSTITLGAKDGKLGFSLEMENDIMGSILDDKEDPNEAAAAWLERVGDLMKNIAEDLVYLDTGRIVRHAGKPE